MDKLIKCHHEKHADPFQGIFAITFSFNQIGLPLSRSYTQRCLLFKIISQVSSMRPNLTFESDLSGCDVAMLALRVSWASRETLKQGWTVVACQWFIRGSQKDWVWDLNINYNRKPILITGPMRKVCFHFEMETLFIFYPTYYYGPQSYFIASTKNKQSLPRKTKSIKFHQRNSIHFLF